MIYIAIMEGGLKFYKLPNEKLHIGDAWFYKISYSFFGSPERFMRVDLYFYGERNYELLESICQGKFGEETTKGLHEHAWISPETTVVLVYDVADDKGFLSLGDWTIFSEYTEPNRTRTKSKFLSLRNFSRRDFDFSQKHIKMPWCAFKLGKRAVLATD